MLTSIIILMVVAVGIFYYLGIEKIKLSEEQLKISKKQIELSEEQLEASQKQIEVSQKAQYSEQFLKSVEQLASQDLGVLLGGLASLDDLSHQNKEEYRRVWEYLGNFLRHHKPLQPEAEKPYPVAEVIAKMLRERNTDYEDFRLDLSEVNLKRMNLEGANLSSAILQIANLEETDLKEVNLEEVNLEEVNLWRANLGGANLMRANLEEASLDNANLLRSILLFANLGNANLGGANLGGANLVGANLESANLREANLDGARLVGARLVGALFGGTFGGKDEAQDLTNLTPEQLRGTYYDNYIRYPIPKFPANISEEDKPKAISLDEWLRKYRPEFHLPY